MEGGGERANGEGGRRERGKWEGGEGKVGRRVRGQCGRPQPELSGACNQNCHAVVAH